MIVFVVVCRTVSQSVKKQQPPDPQSYAPGEQQSLCHSEYLEMDVEKTFRKTDANLPPSLCSQNADVIAPQARDGYVDGKNGQVRYCGEMFCSGGTPNTHGFCIEVAE